MNLPILKVPGNRREQYTVAFRGVRYGEGARDGELEDSRNLTSERFPCLSPRGGRSTEGIYGSATAVFFKGKMLVVDGTKLLYGGAEIADISTGEKQIVAVNSKAVIFPDKIMYDTETGEVRSLEAIFQADNGAVEFLEGKTVAVHMGSYTSAVLRSGNKGGASSSAASINEKLYPFAQKLSSVSVNSETGEITFGSTVNCPRAESVPRGMLFVDASLGADGVSTWGVVTARYRSPITPVGPGGTASDEPDYYGFDYDICGVRGTSYSGFSGFEALGFRVGDTVEISGCTMYPEHNKSCTIRGFGTYTTSDGTELPTLVFDPETFSGTGVEAGAVTIRRKVPNLSVICESSNRLWGAEGNTIYASALGDPTNFFTYDGLDTDSYAVAVASEGNFTGCCGYGSAVLFFKEDRLYKILGSYPSQYTMYDYTVPGVKNGSEKSLRNLNEVIYYHGREGVYRYSGGAPELISENFGLRRFQNASAGAEGYRYYISMQDVTSKEWGLWVYDIQRGLWLQEDGMQAVDFACDGGNLYAACGTDGVWLLNPDSSGETVEWSATLARMDETVHDSKCYSRLTLRAEIPDGAWLQVALSCDGGPFQLVYTDHDTKARVRDIPILPNGCDSFRVRLSGEGPVIIRSMVREYRLSNAVR